MSGIVGSKKSGVIGQLVGVDTVGIRTANPSFCDLEVSDKGGSQPTIGLVSNHTGNANSRNWQLKTNQNAWGDLCFMVSSANNTTPNGTEAVKLHSNGRLLVPAAYSTTSGNAANVEIDSNGEFHRSTSSRRYKRNISDFNEKGLAEILKVRTVSFKGAEGQVDSESTHVGFIAEEIDEAGLSEIVLLNDEGVIDSINYQGLSAVMCTAIQELSAKNDALEAENTAMKTRMDALEARLTKLEVE